MTTEVDIKYDDPMGYRYCDHPRPGSIYRLPDIPELVRGPTVVLLPSGKEIKVPQQMKHHVVSPGEVHTALAGQNKLQDLMKILTAKQVPAAPAGFKLGRAPAYQRNRDHPAQSARIARHQGTNLAF